MTDQPQKERALQMAHIIDGWPESISTEEFERKVQMHFGEDTVGNLFRASEILDTWHAQRRARRH